MLVIDNLGDFVPIHIMEFTMKLEMLPTDPNKAVLATVTQNNEVVWAYDNRHVTETGHPWNVDAGDVPSPFLVWREGKIVHVEACGWHDPSFHFKLSITDIEPYQVVILAYETAGLMEAARE